MRRQVAVVFFRLIFKNYSRIFYLSSRGFIYTNVKQDVYAKFIVRFPLYFPASMYTYICYL